MVNADSSAATAAAEVTYHTSPLAGGTSVLVTDDGTGVSEDHDQLVSLQTDTEGALIYYCATAGCTPNPYSSSTHLYSSKNPIKVAGNGTTISLSAVALKALMLPSAVASITMTINYAQASSPAFDQAAGTYYNPITVNITDSTTGATIWYTTDGSTPVVGGSGSTQSSSPVAVPISATTTLKAIAISSDRSASPVTSATYTIQAYAPTFDHAAGTYLPFTLTVDDATPGVSVWYTTDGSQPVPGSSSGGLAPYTVSINRSETITAVASSSSYSKSVASSVSFTIHQIFTADGSFTIPSGTTTIQIKTWGGGGGGAQQMGSAGAGSSGGGGAFVGESISVTPGDTYEVWIGAGGAASQTSPPTMVSSLGGGMTVVARKVNTSSYTIVAIAGGGGGGGDGNGSTGSAGGGGGLAGEGLQGNDGGPAGSGGTGGTDTGLDYNCNGACAGGNQSLTVIGKPAANGGPGKAVLLGIGAAAGGSGGSGYGGGSGGTEEYAQSSWQTGGGGGGGGNYGVGAATITAGTTQSQSASPGAAAPPGNTTDADYVTGCGVGGSTSQSGTAGCAVIIFE